MFNPVRSIRTCLYVHIHAGRQADRRTDIHIASIHHTHNQCIAAAALSHSVKMFPGLTCVLFDCSAQFDAFHSRFLMI